MLLKSKIPQFWLIARTSKDGVQKYRLNFFRLFSFVILVFALFSTGAFFSGYDLAKRYFKDLKFKELAEEKNQQFLKRKQKLTRREKELADYKKSLVRRLNELSGLLKNASDAGVISKDSLKKISFHTSDYSNYSNDFLELLANYASTIKFIPLGSPVDKYKLSSGFGYRVSPVSYHKHFHDGLDLATSYGANVRSTAFGRVKAVKRMSGYGLLVDVEHGKGLVTRYAHLSGVTVKVGQLLVRGEVLGFVGNSGTSTGPHLHYEIIVNGQAKNPRPLLEVLEKFKPEVLLASITKLDTDFIG